MATAPALGYDGLLSYSTALDTDPEWAMSEGSRFFDERGRVHETLERITGRLETLGIPYAVLGGMALFRHGYRRFTEDVDLLMTRDDARRAHDALRGRGFLPPFEKSKNLRDTQTGVKIDLVITGGYPGDGKPQSITFPDPRDVAIELDGMKVVRLSTLIELKLASGMSGTGRIKDFGDVQELIRELRLPLDLADQLDPSVRERYGELHSGTIGPDPIQDEEL